MQKILSPRDLFLEIALKRIRNKTKQNLYSDT